MNEIVIAAFLSRPADGTAAAAGLDRAQPNASTVAVREGEVYQRWDFRELPGRPMRLFLTAHQLDALMVRGAVGK